MANIYDSIIYKDVLDAQAIRAAQEKMSALFSYEMGRLKQNQFLLTADEQGIEEAEKMFQIIPDVVNESLEFRRRRVLNRNTTKPPYTFRYLKQKLDEILGEGKYTMHRDLANRSLYVESSVESSGWYTEVSLAIETLKPANIVYINNPYLSNSINVAETIDYGNIFYNYRLGASWMLGQKPFRSIEGGDIVKMPQIQSLKGQYLNEIAAFSIEDVASARVNGAVEINELDKSVNGNEGTVEYLVAEGQAKEITKVELLNRKGEILSSSVVYIPVNGPVLVKHKIAVQEGGL